jgi:hypothetical protein
VTTAFCRCVASTISTIKESYVQMLEVTPRILLCWLAVLAASSVRLHALHAEPIGTQREGVSIQRASIWQSPRIPVCWENPGDDAQQLLFKAQNRNWMPAFRL